MSNLSRSSLTSQSLIPTQIISLIFAITALLSYILFFYNIPEVTGYSEYFPNRLTAIHWLLGHLLRAILLTWICIRLSRYVRAAKKAIRLNNDENHAVPQRAIKALRTFAISLVIISIYACCTPLIPNQPHSDLYMSGPDPDNSTTHNLLSGQADISFHVVQDFLCDSCLSLPLKDSNPPEELFVGAPIATRDNFESILLISDDTQTILNFKIKPEFAEEWNFKSQLLIDRQIAFVINKQIISAPTIRSPLSNDFQLTGNLHPNDIKDFIQLP